MEKDLTLVKNVLATFRGNNFNMVSQVIYNVLTCVRPEDLYYDIDEAYESWKKELKKTNKSFAWAGAFHKSLRQTDVFSNTYYEWGDSLIETEDEEKEYRELRKWYRGHFSRIEKKHDYEIKYSELVKQIHEIDPKKFDKYKDYCRQNFNKSRMPISGQLDMILYNIILLDKQNTFAKTLNNIFEDYHETAAKTPNSK